jgi:tetratricopeptide (TPR) repeat protein
MDTLPSAFDAGLAALLSRQWTVAEAAFNEAALQRPEDPGPHIGLGRVRRMQGDLAGARTHLQKALELDPDNADALNNLAQVLRAMGLRHGAIPRLIRAHEVRPADVTIFSNLVGALCEAGRHEEAIERAQARIEADPEFLIGWVALSESLLGARKPIAAAAAAAKAVQLSPAHSGARVALAQAYNACGRHEEAVGIARAAFAMRKGDVKARLCLSNILASAGYADEALALAQLARGPEGGDQAEMAVARAAFFAGAYDIAWPAFEARWTFSPSPAPKLPVPAWRGEDVAGKTVLLVAEQGMGDSVQFARYAWAIAKRGGRAVLHLQEDLAPLFTRLPADIRFAADFDPKSVDIWAPLLSAPVLLGMSAPMAPPPGYITAPVGKTAPTALNEPGLKVGLVWAGNPDHPNDALRSASLKALAPLLTAPGVHWVSVQHGGARAEIEALGLRTVLPDLGAGVADWGDAAACLAGLDLLISVDTAPAHVAAAMGKPVWMLTPACPDWRWGLKTPLSPWYPSLRLVRQTKAGDWSDCVGFIAAELKRRLVEPKSDQTARSA